MACEMIGGGTVKMQHAYAHDAWVTDTYMKKMKRDKTTRHIGNQNNKWKMTWSRCVSWHVLNAVEGAAHTHSRGGVSAGWLCSRAFAADCGVSQQCGDKVLRCWAIAHGGHWVLAAGCIKPRTPTIHAAVGDSCQPFTRPLVTALETFALLLFRIHYVTFRLIASSLAVWPTTCALHHRVQHVTLTVTLTALRAIDHEARPPLWRSGTLQVRRSWSPNLSSQISPKQK